MIPQVTLGFLCPDSPLVRVLEPDAVSGNISELEMLVLASVIASRAPRACFEIGTFDGRTTLNLAAQRCAWLPGLYARPSERRPWQDDS